MDYESAVQASVSLTGSTKNTAAVMEAMGKGWNTPERMEALVKVMGKAFPDAAERMKTSISGLSMMIANEWDSMKEQIVGNPYEGLTKIYKESLQNFLGFLQKYRNQVIAVFKGIGEVLGFIWNFFSDIIGKVLSKVDEAFSRMTGKVGDFHKDIVLPFITFLEIVKVNLMDLVDGILEGFLNSPLWPIWRDVLSTVADVMGDIISVLGDFFGITSEGSASLQTLGEWVGFAASAFVSYWLIMKLQERLANGIECSFEHLQCFRSEDLPQIDPNIRDARQLGFELVESFDLRSHAEIATIHLESSLRRL
jgi:hypothetical protein